MRNHIIFIAVGIILAGGLAYFTFFNNVETEPQDFSEQNFFSQGIPLFSLSSFSPMECAYVNDMKVKYMNDATFYEVAVDSSGDYNPVIQYDVTNRNDGRVIDKIRVDINQKCGFIDSATSFKTNTKTISVDGFVNFVVFTGSIDNDIELISPKIVPVKTTLVQDQWKVISSYTIDVQPLEAKLILHNGINAWIKVFAKPQVSYTLTYKDNTSQNVGKTDPLGIATMSAWLVKADANVITPPEPNANTSNEPIFLESIRTTLTALQGGQDGIISDSNPLDTNKQSGRQLEFKGTVRKWLSTEGLPYIKITDVSGIQVTKFTMLLSAKEGDDGKFVGYYSMPENSKNGKYTVIMQHPNRFQGDFKTLQSSVKTFIVENTVSVSPSDFKTKETCIGAGYTWNIPSDGTSSSCVSKIGTQQGVMCAIYDKGVCKDASGNVLETDGGITKISTTPQTFFGRVVLLWTATYENGKSQSGVIGSEEGFTNQLQSLSLANSVDDVDSLLKQLQITPVLQFKDSATTSQFSIETSDVTFATKITIGTETFELDTRKTILFQPTKALCITEPVKQTTTCANTGFSLGSMILSSDAVTNKIEGTSVTWNKLPQGGTAKTKIVVDIAGTFDARNNVDGKKYTGSTKGSQFTWDTTYVKGSLGQKIVVVVDTDTGETTAKPTTDDTKSDSENPEKILITSPTKNPAIKESGGCAYETDTWYYKSDVCADIGAFSAEVKARKDGTCQTKDFPDSNGIEREVTVCSELSQNIDDGGAGGKSSGGLGNNSDGNNVSGLFGLGGVCEGTVLECASAFQEGIDDKLKEKIGLDSVELGLLFGGILFILIIIGGLSAVAKKRNNTFNPMSYR